jgi:hypothetical protein
MPVVVGTEWEQISLKFSATGAVGVGDRLWVVGTDGDDLDSPPVLAYTDDGTTWRTVNLAALGIPIKETDKQAAEKPDSVLASVDGELYGVIAAPPQEGVSADGVSTDLWVVTTDGAPDGEVIALEPEETGLDQRVEGPDNFRIDELGGMAGRDGQVHVAAVGLWWLRDGPTAGYKRDYEFAAISLPDTDSWVTYTEDLDDPEDNSFIDLAGIVALDDRFVAVGKRGSEVRFLFSYVSTDGVTWTQSEPDPPLGEWVEVYALAASSERVVAAGLESASFASLYLEGFPVSWWSDDGVEWNRVELPVVEPENETDMRVVPLSAVWTGEQYMLFGSNGPTGREVVAIWTSPDGVEWSVLETEFYPMLRIQDAVMWQGRVVAVGSQEVAYSPRLD